MWTLVCQKCGKSKDYSIKSNYNRALRGNRLCSGCARIGQKRTPEQCQRISVATKKAMSNPQVYEKLMASYTPENRLKRSENTKKQMKRILSDPIKKKNYIKKHSQKGKKWWINATKVKREIFLNSGRAASKALWDDPLYREMVSNKMKGDKNPFYGKKHTPETIEKLRKATTERLIKFWKSEHLIGINTIPERKMQTLLKQNNIEFQTPFVLENKIYDLYLPSYNTLIEVDGCYWHSKNVPLSEMNSQQLRRWKNDRFKDSLAHKHGYKLLRVWEDEIEQFNIYKELIINE